MAGGSGTRFWPASRPENPKQYLSFLGGESLIQNTVSRLAPDIADGDVYVCSTTSQSSLLKKQLPSLKHLISEPEGKNTSACVALSAIEMIKSGLPLDTVMLTLPADHFISDEKGFRKLLQQAATLAREKNLLITFGIVPQFAHTGYGYIEQGAALGNTGAFQVSRFVEKPDQKKAEEYLATKRFHWNSGMFVWTLGAIASAFKEFLPKMWSEIEAAVQKNTLATAYSKIESIPIDVGIMEKAKNVAVIPADIGWNDVGSWSAVYDLQKPDSKGNVVLNAPTSLTDASNCLVFAPSHVEVGLVGVKDLIVVVDGNRVLVCHKDSDQQVRETAKRFK